MGVGFPYQSRRVRHAGHKLHGGRQMNGGFSSQQHDGVGPPTQGRHRPDGQRWGVKNRSRLGIPALRAANAKHATQIAPAKSDGKSRNEFDFIGNFRLREENSRLRPGAAPATRAAEAINAAMMLAQMAFRQHRPGQRRPQTRGEGPACSRPSGQRFESRAHNSSRLMRWEAPEELAAPSPCRDRTHK